MTGEKGNGSAIGRVLDALTVVGGPDRKGEYRAFCPAHDDRKTPNLRIREAEDGRVLLHCFAGCGQDNVLSALAEKGIGESELFTRNGRGGGRGSTTTQDHVHACTLEAYAEAKKLPLEFLVRLRNPEIDVTLKSDQLPLVALPALLRPQVALRQGSARHTIRFGEVGFIFPGSGPQEILEGTQGDLDARG